MSSQDKNLSDLHYPDPQDTAELRVAIICSEWNGDITKRLLEGAQHSLEQMGLTEKQIRIEFVPGSYELPIGAQMCIDESDPAPNAVICLGCVIRGETSHFDYVCQAVSLGIQEVSLKYNLPVIFGVLTDDTKDQSIARSGGTLGNKGEEAAVTAVKMALLQRKIVRNKAV